jgi:hypothetical protein
VALQERAIAADALRTGIREDRIDLVVDHLVDGSCVFWR